MRIAVLGPLEVVDDSGVPVDVAGAKERLLLAVLAAHAGRVVPTGQLVEAMWDGSAPPTARKTLQIHVVHLRSALEPSRPRGSAGRFVVRRADGYALEIEPQGVDAQRMADLVRQGRGLRAAGDLGAAARCLGDAVALWRGTPFADWPDAGFARVERHRLMELRLAAVTALLDVRLALGEAAEVVSDAERLVADDELREESWRLLVLALYRSGRQADALAAAARARRVLREEVGADPGPALRNLEAAVLAQDPALDVPGTEPEPARPRGAVACPYKGLSAYQRDDADLFAGRDRVTRNLVARLVDTSVLVVSGPSGAGKSSVVRAGLLPALAAGAIPGSGSWDALVVTPTERPVDGLARLTGEAAPSRPVVLVCDQFEQLWAPVVDRQEREAFLGAVLGLLDDGVLARCVVVVRGDAVGRLAEHAAFAERMGSRLVLVPPLTDDELREVLREPAAAVGLEVDDDLVAAVVADVHGRPGALPLLSTALVGTWERRCGDRLTLAGYLGAGGVAGALAESAEAVWLSLDEEQRGAARRLLVRLADTDDSGALIRRAVPLTELDLSGRGGGVRRAVVDAFVTRRLLAVDQDRLEVAHEALLVAWPRLARWLEDDAAGRAVRRHLVPAAVDWTQRGEPNEDLYRGARLAAAVDWAAENAEALTPVEQRFLDASRARSEAELEHARARARQEARGRRRTRRLAAGLAAVLVLALVATVLAVRSSSAARQASLAADANRLAALSDTAESLDVALLLAVQGVRLADTPEAEDGLFTALLEHPRAVRAARLPGRPLLAEVGGRPPTLFAGIDGHLVTWSAEGSAPPRAVLPLTAPDWEGWTEADVSPTERLVVAAGQAPGGSWIRAADADGADRELVGRNVLAGRVLDLAFTQDGRRVLVLTARDEGNSASRWALHEVDPHDGHPQRTGVEGRLAIPAGDLRADFADEASDLAVVWSAAPGGPASLVQLNSGGSVSLRLTARPVPTSAFRALPTGAVQLWSDGLVTVYDRSGRAVQELGAHASTALDAVMSHDGRWAATVGRDAAVTLWDVDPNTGRWTRRESMTAHEGDVVEAGVDDAGRLFTVSLAGTVVVWDTAEDGGWVEPFPPLTDRYISNRPQPIPAEGLLVAPTRPLGADSSGRFPPDSGTAQVAATFLDARTGALVDEVVVGDTFDGILFGSSVAVSPDGSAVAVTSGHAVTVLDARTRKQLARFEEEAVSCAGWTPDGERLLLGVERYVDSSAPVGELVVVDRSTWRRIGKVPVGGAQALEVSPDGSQLAVARSDAAEVVVLDPRTLEVAGRVPVAGDDRIFDLSFSRDGRLLAAGGRLGLLHIFDTRTWRPVGEPADVQHDHVLQTEWLPTGHTVASSGADGTVTLFDADRGLLRTGSLPASGGAEVGMAYLFFPSAEELVVLAGERPGRRYPIDRDVWLSTACAIAGRDLTEEEWQRYLPGREHQPTCSRSG